MAGGLTFFVGNGKYFGKGARPGRITTGRGGEARLAGPAAGPAGARNPQSTQFARHPRPIARGRPRHAQPEARKALDSRLEIIHGELHRLESIVERFLRLAGPSALDLEPVEIPKIVTHVCELLRPEAATRQIEIVAQIEYGLPPVTADPVRLTQALMNLVINAIQAVEKNGRVEVSAVKPPPAMPWSCGCRTTDPASRRVNWRKFLIRISRPNPKAAGLGFGLPSRLPWRTAAPCAPKTRPPVAPSSPCCYP